MKFRALPALVLLTAAAGCADEEPAASNTSICDRSETAYEDYAAGISKTGENGLVTITLADALPSPPNKGDNTWTLMVADAQGSAMADATVTAVTPFMPEHGHGTNVKATIEGPDATGMATINNVDFMMPGVWEVRVDVETADSQTDTATFAFCIEG